MSRTKNKFRLIYVDEFHGCKHAACDEVEKRHEIEDEAKRTSDVENATWKDVRAMYMYTCTCTSQLVSSPTHPPATGELNTAPVPFPTLSSVYTKPRCLPRRTSAPAPTEAEPCGPHNRPRAAKIIGLHAQLLYNLFAYKQTSYGFKFRF